MIDFKNNNHREAWFIVFASLAALYAVAIMFTVATNHVTMATVISLFAFLVDVFMAAALYTKGFED